MCLAEIVKEGYRSLPTFHLWVARVIFHKAQKGKRGWQTPLRENLLVCRLPPVSKFESLLFFFPSYWSGFSELLRGQSQMSWKPKEASSSLSDAWRLGGWRLWPVLIAKSAGWFCHSCFLSLAQNELPTIIWSCCGFLIRGKELPAHCTVGMAVTWNGPCLTF